MIKLVLAVCLIFSKTIFVPLPSAKEVAITYTLEAPANGGCEECYGNTCVQAPCNFDCKHHGTWCETFVMGGAQQEYTPETKLVDGDYAEFYIQRVMKNNKAMEAAGIKVGDTITHVNDIFAESARKFGELVIRLPKGTRLRVMKQNGEREEVRL